jgi:hypothetical protein
MIGMTTTSRNGACAGLARICLRVGTAYLLFLQVLVGGVSAAAVAADRMLGLDRLSALCSGDMRPDSARQDDGRPTTSHRQGDTCCVWGCPGGTLPGDAPGQTALRLPLPPQPGEISPRERDIAHCGHLHPAADRGGGSRAPPIASV